MVLALLGVFAFTTVETTGGVPLLFSKAAISGGNPALDPPDGWLAFARGIAVVTAGTAPPVKAASPPPPPIKFMILARSSVPSGFRNPSESTMAAKFGGSGAPAK